LFSQRRRRLLRRRAPRWGRGLLQGQGRALDGRPAPGGAGARAHGALRGAARDPPRERGGVPEEVL